MKTKQIMICGMSALLLLSGCSMMKKDEKEMKKDTKDVSESVKDGASNLKDQANTSIKDFTKYLDDNKISYRDMKKVEAVDFSAKEGAMFTYNNQPIYLYRLNDQDETMKALLKEAKKNKKVNVNIEGEKKEMQANVNGSYLMLYENGEKVSDLRNAFTKFNTSINESNKK